MPYVQFQIRRDLAANWSASTANPVLASGEMGLETDTGKFKFGDGSNVWTALPYVATGGGGGGGGAVTESLIPTQDNQFDLGAPGSSFRSLYVGGNTIHIGNATISASAAGNVVFTNTITNQTTTNITAPPAVSGTLAGNMSMIGGGTVTWASDSLGGAISWTGNITLVTNRTNADTSEGTLLKITPSTVRMNALDSLYYTTPLGSSDESPSELRVINGADLNHDNIQDNWFLLANTSIDNTIVKWNPGAVCIPPEGTYDSNTATGSWFGGGGGSGGGSVIASLIPTNDNLYDLGAPGASFRSLYVGPNSIHIGDAIISASADGNLVFTNTLTNQSTSNTSAPPLVSGTLAGNMSMIGGGEVSWVSQTLSWSDDITIVTNTDNYSNQAHPVLKIPVSSVVLASLDSLYYVLASSDSIVFSEEYSGNLQIINGYDPNRETIADNWFLVANTNTSGSALKWNPGSICIPTGGTYDSELAQPNWYQKPPDPVVTLAALSETTALEPVRYLSVATNDTLELTVSDSNRYIALMPESATASLTITVSSDFPVNGTVFIKNCVNRSLATTPSIGLPSIVSFTSLSNGLPVFDSASPLAPATSFSMFQWDGTRIILV